MEHEYKDIDMAAGQHIARPITEDNTSKQDVCSAMATKAEFTAEDTNMQDGEMDEADGIPLTHALEALLGGPPPSTTQEDQDASTQKPLPVPEIKTEDETMGGGQEPATTVTVPSQNPVVQSEELETMEISREQALARPQDATIGASVQAGEVADSAVESESATLAIEPQKPAVPETSQAEAAQTPSIPGLTLHMDSNIPQEPAVEENKVVEGSSSIVDGPLPPTADTTEVDGEHPEWEVDSSPIESSSDDSSSDDSSDSESEDGDNANILLSLEEQAKILMEDGDSDNEGGTKAKGAGGPLRTKNEVAEVIIPKPDVTITPDTKIEELGAVETIVDNILLIKANVSGEYRVLESGSVLFLADRTVVGVVAEPMGRVQQPLYSVMFTNATELKESGLELGTKVYYTEKHSTYVFTQALKAYKGSDASNLHDEEVGNEEMEFSDDEAEAEHKRRVKQAKSNKRGGKMQNGAFGRGGHPLQESHQPYDPSRGINYDDDEDGPYKPLARPNGYASTLGHSEAPQEGSYNGQSRPAPLPNRDNFRGRGRGDRGNGRGDRGRGRGDRGRGRGGQQDRRGDGYSQPPQQNFVPPPPPGMGFPPFAQTPGATPNFYMPQMPQMPQMPSQFPAQQQQAWPQFTPPAQFQQAFQGMQNNWQASAMAAAQTGGFLNPAFFQSDQAAVPQPQWNQQNHNQQNQQNGRGRGN